MEFRELVEGDFSELFKLVQTVYIKNPNAMWFSKLPTEEDFKATFVRKMANVKDKIAVDLVAVECEKIAGECEILREDGYAGRVGIIVRSGYRELGLGHMLLSESSALAGSLGIRCINAEVSEDNKGAISFFLREGFSVHWVGSKSIEREGIQHRIIVLKRCRD